MSVVEIIEKKYEIDKVREMLAKYKNLEIKNIRITCFGDSGILAPYFGDKLKKLEDGSYDLMRGNGVVAKRIDFMLSEMQMVSKDGKPLEYDWAKNLKKIQIETE
jgi:hypothetical protein